MLFIIYNILCTGILVTHIWYYTPAISNRAWQSFYLHLDTRRVIGVEPPHATRVCACVPVPAWSGYSRFPLPDSTTATCSRCNSFAGGASNGAHGGSTRCGRLYCKKREMIRWILFSSFKILCDFIQDIMLTIAVDRYWRFRHKRIRTPFVERSAAL